MKQLKFLLMTFLMAANFACGNFKETDVPPPLIEIALGQEFTLKQGQTALISGENLQIAFGGVKSDSRCPADVQCFWEGDAEVVLNVNKVGSNEGTTINLHANRKFVQSAKYQQYEIKLVYLSRENVAKLVVSKK